MIRQLKAELAIGQCDQLGEGPVWDASGRRLLWGDHVAHVIREAQSDGAGGWRETRRWELHRPLAAAIPRSTGGLILAAGMDILTFDENAPTVDRAIQPFAHIDVNSDLLRINDAKCDAKGRLWAGTLSSDFKPGAAALYRIDPDGTVAQKMDGMTLANGLDWSPDSSTFYFVESFTREVLAFDFDLETGSISNRRTFVTLTNGVPNGMTVDRGGNLWIASTGGGEVQCYSPQGQLIATVEIATPGATSCCFGGPDGLDLFITSRAGRMPEAAKTMGVDPRKMDNSGPEAGALFVCRPGASGPPAHSFAR
jgi:sugar lactone lactonase YvrE